MGQDGVSPIPVKVIAIGVASLMVLALLIFVLICCAKKRKDEMTKVHVIGDAHAKLNGGYSSRNALKGTASTEQNKRDITNAGSEMDDELSHIKTPDVAAVQKTESPMLVPSSGEEKEMVIFHSHK